MQSIVVFLATLLLFAEIGSPLAMGQTGVALSFRGVSLPNNSYVDIGGFDDIGAGVTQVCDAQALLCHTDKRDCCSPPQTSSRNKLGDWYFPNRTAIVAITETFEKGLHDYFARNRDLGVIRLYVSGVPLERGRFQCEVPNANDVMETLYANILDIGDVIISPSGPNNTTFGQPLTLECYATISPYPLPQNVSPPRFEWFHGLSMEPLSDDFIVSISSTMLKDGNTYASFLNFSSLHESHAGLYTCQLGGNKRLAASRMVLVTTTVQEGFNSGNNGSTCDCDHTMTITLAAVFNISTVFIAVVVITALLIKNKRQYWEGQTDSKATTMLSENIAYGIHVNNNRSSSSLPQALTQHLPGLTTTGDAEERLNCPLYETIDQLESNPTRLQQLTPAPATNNRTRIKINSYTTPPRP